MSPCGRPFRSRPRRRRATRDDCRSAGRPGAGGPGPCRAREGRRDVEGPCSSAGELSVTVARPIRAGACPPACCRHLQPESGRAPPGEDDRGLARGSQREHVRTLDELGRTAALTVARRSAPIRRSGSRQHRDDILSEPDPVRPHSRLVASERVALRSKATPTLSSRRTLPRASTLAVGGGLSRREAEANPRYLEVRRSVHGAAWKERADAARRPVLCRRGDRAACRISVGFVAVSCVGSSRQRGGAEGAAAGPRSRRRAAESTRALPCGPTRSCHGDPAPTRS